MNSIQVKVNDEVLPPELTALISSVIGGNTIDAKTGDTRTATLKERGDNIRTMAGNAGFAGWVKSLGDSGISIHLQDENEEGESREKVYTVNAKNFIPFLKNWDTLLGVKEAIASMATVQRFGVWGERGRKSTRESADDVLSRGLASLNIEAVAE